MLNQQEDVERETETAFNVREMQKEKNRELLERERGLQKNEDELVPYGTLRTGNVEDSDFEDTTLRTATLRTDDFEDRRL